jgi:prepilin-type N-terminal cleavage/methylation domain-containing protein/prepilin-type processing-associated H-X9-DG protein
MLGLKMVRSKAFTLIEILIVLAVLAVLAGLMFPVLGHVRQRSQQATCQSNMRQLALAIQQYVKDNDSRYPSWRQWRVAALQYGASQQIFQCPTPRANPDYPDYNLGGIYTNYNYNRRLDAGYPEPASLSTQGGLNESVVTKPSQDLLLKDLDVDGPVVEGHTDCGTFRIPSLHFGSMNFAFCDGHVKWMPAQQGLETVCAGRQR